MMDDHDKDQKTEDATPRRVEKAREQGDRLRSREIGILILSFTLVLMLDFMWVAGWGVENFYQFFIGSISKNEYFPHDQIIWGLVKIFTPVFLMIFLAMIVLFSTHALFGGLGFQFEAIAPKWSRLFQIFQSSGKKISDIGVDGIRSLARVLAILFFFIFFTFFYSHNLLAHQTDIQSRMAVFHFFMTFGFYGILGISAVLLLVDIPLEWSRYYRKLRMSREEIRQEVKDSEGAPEIRAAIKRRQREMLQRAIKPMVSQANVVITNPTHYAVVLRYNPDTDGAPIILTKGRGVMALAIMDAARELVKPIVCIPEFSRALYFSSPIGRHIDSDLYIAAATILAFLARLGPSYASAPIPVVEIPAHLRFDSEGKKI